jgi:hypothetical protein
VYQVRFKAGGRQRESDYDGGTTFVMRGGRILWLRR